MFNTQDESFRLAPLPPVGSVYFSQAHSLRWMESGKADPSLFYREILAHALFFEALVISDSYMIFNWLLKEMLPGGRFYEQFPGVEELIRYGAVRVARRKRKSLDETARELIRRQIPVMVDGHLTRASEEFLPHASTLDRLTENNQLVYQTTDIRLADRIISDILAVDTVCGAYGLSPQLRDETAVVVNQISDNGVLYAAELFYYPERYSAGLLGQNAGTIQKLVDVSPLL